MPADITLETYSPSSVLQRLVQAVTIANGAASSQKVDGQGRTLVGVITPGMLTQTALRFNVSADGETWVPLLDDTNTRYSITVAVSSAYALNPAKMKAWRYVQVNMGGNEGAERTLTLLFTGV